MTAQNIFRTTHATNFTVLPNQIWNAGLSVSATAALGYILSKPPTWKIRITDLRNKLRLGRDKVYRTLQELCAAGYAKMTRLQRGVRWEFFDTPQIFETSDTTEPTPDSRLPEIKLTNGQGALKKNEIPLVIIEEKQLQVAPVTLNDPAPKKEIVVAQIEEIKPITAPTLPDPEIVKAIEKLTVTQSIKPSLIKTLAALTLVEAKAVLAILSRAITLGTVKNPAGYAVELSKRAKDGTLTPLTTNYQPTLSERLAKQEADRQEDAKRHKITNEQWVAMMAARGIKVQI